jgi:D-alanyl-D-alanine dipeptidase
MFTFPRCLLVALPIALALGCSSAEEDDSAEYEDPPAETGADALTSTVDCHLKNAPAYDHGSPFTIEVITIGGKPAAKPTGDAFLKMQKAADAAGVKLSINSGFRTMAEQQHLYSCYQTGNCNNGNLAAKPGYSNHQSGRALDLTVSSWLVNNAAHFGFKRTVPSEAWHYEFFGNDPGGPCDGTPPDAPATNPTTPTTTTGGGAAPAGAGHACVSDGQCNPGNDGAGLICQGHLCVAGCHTNAQCGGNTSCVSGQCR